MKTKSPMFRSTGVLVALLTFIALPSWTALANCGQCADVDLLWEYGGGTGIYFELSVANPTSANIYYTTTVALGTPADPPDPTWDASGNPTGTTQVCYSCTSRDVPVPYNYTMKIKARAWKSCYYASVNVSYDDVHNPNL